MARVDLFILFIKNGDTVKFVCVALLFPKGRFAEGSGAFKRALLYQLSYVPTLLKSNAFRLTLFFLWRPECDPARKRHSKKSLALNS